MGSLPRSTRAGRGQLAGPASSARQVRAVTVRIEQPEPGVMQLSTSFGWRSGLARNPAQLASLVAAAFTEAQIDAHARWRGLAYDRADGSRGAVYRRPRPARRGSRVDVHDPREWRVAEDGRWVAPGSGRLWRPDSQTVQRVQAQRVKLGLSASPVDAPQGRTGVLRGRSA